MHVARLTLVPILLTVCCVGSPAQSAAFHPNGQPARTPATPAHSLPAGLSSELDQLYRTARQYTTDLSKITCDETIHSEQNSSGNGFTPRPVHWKMDTQGRYTAVKSSGGVGGFKDQHDYNTQDGKPVPAQKKVVHPYLLTDAFAPAALSYLSPARRACLRFSRSPGRVDFATLPGAGGKGDCADIAPEAHGYLLFDASTHTLSHLERTVPLEASRAGGFAPFASVDYEAYGVDGQLYMLPMRIVAKKADKSLEFTFEGRYSGCQLFKSKIKMYTADGKEIPDTSPTGH